MSILQHCGFFYFLLTQPTVAPSQVTCLLEDLKAVTNLRRIRGFQEPVDLEIVGCQCVRYCPMLPGPPANLIFATMLGLSPYCLVNSRSCSNCRDLNLRYSAPTVEQPETFHYEAGFEPWNIVEADWTLDNSGNLGYSLPQLVCGSYPKKLFTVIYIW